MSETLKPCPFCGGDAEMDTRQGYRALNGNFGSRCVIYCLKCTAEQSFCKEDWDGDRENLAIYVTELWNARAPDPMAARLAEALRTLAPEGWLDDDTMDHMQGVKQARDALRAYGESLK